jgi:hypothetical protein
VQRGFLCQEQASCRGFQVLAPANFLNAGPTALGSSKKADLCSQIQTFSLSSGLNFLGARGVFPRHDHLKVATAWSSC